MARASEPVEILKMRWRIETGLMIERIPLPDVGNRVVVGWRLDERELVLRFKDAPEERSLQCGACGRFHRILREQFRAAEAWFVVTCHHCGTRGILRMEGFALPLR